jgi:hypothetical protein
VYPRTTMGKEEEASLIDQCPTPPGEKKKSYG